MNPEHLTEAMTWLDDGIIMEVISTMEYNKTKHRRISSIRTVLIAAVLVALLATSAIAADIFGIQALLKDFVNTGDEEYALVSLSQPQKVSDDLDPVIAEKVANSRAAWDEWQVWLQENNVRRKMLNELPEKLRVAENCSYGVEEKEDGSALFLITDHSRNDEKEVRLITAEEYEIYKEVIERYGQYESRYDFNYLSDSAEADDMLETIACKYGLTLRGNGKVAWTRGGVTPEQLAESTADMGNAGNIFIRTPEDFDKVYWYGEGTFCVSYYYTLASGVQATCYGYNSMYGTLSSGNEVLSNVQEPDAYTERSYTAADGTDLTILSDGTDAYLYVYLDNSFFAMHISSKSNISEAEINEIADMLDYSMIGK